MSDLTRSEDDVAAAIDIRRARREDVPSIVALLADDELGRTREAVEEPLPARYLTAFEEIDGDPAQLLVVAELDGRIAATLHLTFLRYLTFGGGLRAHVEAVRVARDRRGAGLGRAVLVWAIDHARGRGAHLVQLTTDARRPEAKRFYESLRFQVTHLGMKLHLSD